MLQHVEFRVSRIWRCSCANLINYLVIRDLAVPLDLARRLDESSDDDHYYACQSRVCELYFSPLLPLIMKISISHLHPI